MAKGKRPEITLPKLDDLFSSQESREEESLSKIRDIPFVDCNNKLNIDN